MFVYFYSTLYTLLNITVKVNLLMSITRPSCNTTKRISYSQQNMVNKTRLKRLSISLPLIINNRLLNKTLNKI